LAIAVLYVGGAAAQEGSNAGSGDTVQPPETEWSNAVAAATRTEECMFVQAHRGFSEFYPENTMLAITKALEAGADRIETDLAITRDDVLVLLPDRSLDRTTTGRGRVESFTLPPVSHLDARSLQRPHFARERGPAPAA